MRVTIKCFATLTPHTPAGDVWEQDTLGTVADLMIELGVPADQVKLIFVNGRSVEADTQLADGDRVGLFPPVGGG